MSKLFIAILLAGAAYWVLAHYDGFGRPVYAEFRVKQAETGIELVGLGMIPSESECRVRSDRFWDHIFSSAQHFEIVSAQCLAEVPSRYRDLLAKVPYHATYLSFEKGSIGERDGRFIIYGVPSSEVARVCPELIQRIKQTYSGTVECVRGTIG